MEVSEDVLGAGATAAADLVEQAFQCEPLVFWLEDARKNKQNITLFSCRDADGTRHLQGFVCYHMKPAGAELHMRFMWVPRDIRGYKLGNRMVRWLIARASRMPESRCKWISLDAAEEWLVPWYESFGFCDMTCGPDQFGEIRMELQNVSVVPNEVSNNADADYSEADS